MFTRLLQLNIMMNLERIFERVLRESEYQKVTIKVKDKNEILDHFLFRDGWRIIKEDSEYIFRGDSDDFSYDIIDASSAGGSTKENSEQIIKLINKTPIGKSFILHGTDNEIIRCSIIKKAQ